MKSHTLKKILVLTLSIPLFPLISAAQEPPRGINEQGQPYRVDQEGNEIVDYIAELEVKNEALQRQVHGLEYEAEQAQKQLSALRAGKVEAPLVEKTIKASEPAKAAPAAPVAVAQKSCSREVCKELLSGDISAVDARYQAKVEDLELETKVQENQIRILQGEATQARDRVKELEKLQATRVVSNEGCAQNQAELQATLTSRNQQIASLEQSLKAHAENVSALKTQLAASHTSEETLRAKLESSGGEDEKSQEQLATLKDKLEQKEEALVLANKKIAVLTESNMQLTKTAAEAPSSATASESKPIPSEDTATETRPADTGSLARRNAIETLRGRINTRLNNVKSLIVTRDALYAQYKRQKAQVGLTLKPAVSSRGLGIREISGRLRAVTSVMEISMLSKDISEIETKVREDIALIERLKRRG